ncbi:NAD(P)H-dependent oxidoreductase [uncultured Dokdonia sp.]|uniref:NADPH-dependent FMN reductase n=1 Tax=uncultured Dokdonia sp. TaxID=575653 RepID=UPI00261FAFE0|nr:NAD(P)H-dependent oxidoreductase [uncultured Dokdonia sp.]
MKKIIAFAGSNSKNSINGQLVAYLANQITSASVSVIHLTDYEIPMYSIDIETEQGFPVDVTILKNKISESDGVILSVNEHNGTVSAFFKNILDWLSRVDRNFLSGKKIFLLSTSPGARGGKNALAYTKGTLPHMGGTVVESFSFPSFQENFDSTSKTITNPTLAIGVSEVIASFLQEVDG